MSALAIALRHLVREMTTDQLAEAANAKRATAGNMKADILQEPAKMNRWDGDRIEALAGWERRTYGTTTVADALKGEEAAPSSLEDIRRLMETAQGIAKAIETIAKASEDQRVTHPEWEAILADGLAAQATLNHAVKLARKRITEPRT